MKKIFISMLVLGAFIGVADSAPKSKPNMKKQTMRVRCQPGYMFERGKCIIIPNMDDNPNKR